MEFKTTFALSSYIPLSITSYQSYKQEVLLDSYDTKFGVSNFVRAFVLFLNKKN